MNNTQLKEFVFIPVDGKQTKNIAINPPENLVVEFPPRFSDSELGCAHDNKKKAGKTKKPPNAFILFRKKYVESLHRLGHHDAMKKVSGWARDAWNKLSQAEKDEYEHYANKAASLYQEWEVSQPKSQKNIKTSNPKKTSRKLRGPKNISTSISQIQTQLPTPPESSSSPESIIGIEYDPQNFQQIETYPPTFSQDIIYYPDLMYDTVIPECFHSLGDIYYLNNLNNLNNFIIE